MGAQPDCARRVGITLTVGGEWGLSQTVGGEWGIPQTVGGEWGLTQTVGGELVYQGYGRRLKTWE